RETDHKISRKNAEATAAKVKKEHPVFTSITVVDGGETWDFDYTASPGKKHKGAAQSEGELVSITVSRPKKFRLSTRKDLQKKRPDLHEESTEKPRLLAGYHRRHVVSWKEVKDHYENTLNKKSISAAKKRLEAKGETVDPVTNKGVEEAAQRLANDFF